jgi:hypothetical protein
MRGRPYKTEFAFYGDTVQLEQLRQLLHSSGYEQDKTQTDAMLIMVRT